MANRQGTTWRVTARVEGRPHEFFTITDDNAVMAAIRSKSALLSELKQEYANDLQEGQQQLALAAFHHVLDRHYGGVPHSAVRQGDSFEPAECKAHDFGGTAGNALVQVWVRELR